MPHVYLRPLLSVLGYECLLVVPNATYSTLLLKFTFKHGDIRQTVYPTLHSSWRGLRAQVRLFGSPLCIHNNHHKTRRCDALQGRRNK